MSNRGVIELINDSTRAIELAGTAQAAPPRPSRRRRRADHIVKHRDDHLVTGRASGPALTALRETRQREARQREAVTMSTDDFDARLAAEEMRGLLGLARRKAGPQARVACGPTTGEGYCMSSTHTPACASTMGTAASRATFAPSGSAESDRLWQAAADERRKLAEIARPGGAAAEAARAKERADKARERRERQALAHTGANWATTGRNPEWFTRTA
jgi:hypothetical protein